MSVKALIACLFLLAAALAAEAPMDLPLVRVVTRTAMIFRQADLSSPRKGLVQFRDTFELADAAVVNGFYRIYFSDGDAFIRAADVVRQARPEPAAAAQSASGTAASGQDAATVDAADAGTAPAESAPASDTTTAAPSTSGQALAPVQSAAAQPAVADQSALSAPTKGPAKGLPSALAAKLAPAGAAAPAATGNKLAALQTALSGLQGLPKRPPKAAPPPALAPAPAPADASKEKAGEGEGGAGLLPKSPPDWMIYVPLAWGLGGSTQPAFRPSQDATASRAMDSAFGWGLGVQGRVSRFVDIYGEWTSNRHSTHVADRSQNAWPQGLAGTAPVVFNNGSLDYVMETQVFGLGARLGGYMAPLRPWLGLGINTQLWNASYWDSGNSRVLGSAQGQAVGFELALGLDILLRLFGDGVARVTPFVAMFSPTVSPSIGNVGGSGLDWSDSAGTQTLAPIRLGVQLGVGF